VAAVAVVVAGMLAGAGPAMGQVTAVKGSAFGYFSRISLFDGPAADRGPAPTVTLPAGGSDAPVTATAPSGDARYGPGIFFTSDKLDVSTKGTPAGGTVTSSVNITNLNKSGAEVLTASAVSSTCTASGSGVTGSATITGGKLQTDDGNPNVDGDETVVAVPANPAPNTSYDGKLQSVGDTFRYVFNEQIKNPDGSLTVNAAHQFAIGPTAKGELIIGQVVCGVTGSGATTATTAAPGASTTTTARGAATTTTSPGLATTTTTAAVAVTTTAAPAAATTSSTAPAASTGVGGSAYGFFVRVGLFGGAAATRGPSPTVTLPDAGSATPLTATAPTGDAQFGPAIIFSSDKLDVSTEGTPGGSVTSSATVANVNRSGQEQLTAASVSSKCTASATGESGSASLKGGKLTTSVGTNFDSDADDTVVDLPSDPAPDTKYTGKLEQVGDTFRVTLNEQIKSAGSVTVNAVHLFLDGPVAVGELIIGQSHCATTAAGATAGGGAAGGGSAGGGARVASTGTEVARSVAFALVLAMGGWSVSLWGAGLRSRRRLRSMPWPTRSLLR